MFFEYTVSTHLSGYVVAVWVVECLNHSVLIQPSILLCLFPTGSGFSEI